MLARYQVIQHQIQTHWLVRNTLYPSSSTIILSCRVTSARRVSHTRPRSSCSGRHACLGVSYPVARTSSSRRSSLNEARADISLRRIPIRSPSGDGYVAGVDGIERGVSACAGVDGVDDSPGRECRCPFGDVVGSNGSSGTEWGR